MLMQYNLILNPDITSLIYATILKKPQRIDWLFFIIESFSRSINQPYSFLIL